MVRYSRALSVALMLLSTGCTQFVGSYETRGRLLSEEIEKTTLQSPKDLSLYVDGSELRVGYSYEVTSYVQRSYETVKIEQYKTEYTVPNAGGLVMTLVGSGFLFAQLMSCDEVGFFSEGLCDVSLPGMFLAGGVALLFMLSKPYRSTSEKRTPLPPRTTREPRRTSNSDCYRDTLVDVQILGLSQNMRTDYRCELTFDEDELLALGVHPVTLVQREVLSVRVAVGGQAADADLRLSALDRSQSTAFVQSAVMQQLLSLEFVALMRSSSAAIPVSYKGRVANFMVSTSALGEDFYRAHYARHSATLQARYGEWIENCQALSKGHKELYECLYEFYKRAQ